MVLGTDLGDGNVDILFVLVVFLQRVCFSVCFVIFMSDFVLTIGQQSSFVSSDFGRSKC